MDFRLFLEVTMQLLEGLANTLAIFGITLLFALPLGLLISFGSMSKFVPLAALFKGFVWVIRGTPLMLQIIFFTTVPGMVFNLPVRGTEGFFITACIAFVVNYACYFSEIYRGGIESISQGQYEAGMVLGMSKRQIFFKVVLLQVFKRILPPMSNEIITLVKDTALISVVLHIDLFTVAKDIVNIKVILWPLFYAGAFYLIVNGLLSLFFRCLEKKLDYFKS